jgi:hypothetical protein
MLVEDGEPLCLGWMSRQHGLNSDFIELRRNQRLRDPGLMELMQVIRPKTWFAGETDFGFPRPADLCGHVLLDHIQELERN